MAKKVRLLDQTELTPLQKRFLLQVAILHNVAASARMVGISERTAHRWYDLPLAQHFVREMQEQAFQAAMTALEQMTLSAAFMLNEAMNSDQTTNELKLKAAIAVLNFGMEARRMSMVEKRLAELEERLHLHDLVVKEEATADEKD